MELNVNSPAYFTDHYGIDDEVYRYCQCLYDFFQTKNYSEEMEIVGIVPVAAPEEIYSSGKWKESLRVIDNGKCISAFIHIEFDRYYNADSKGKILLTKEIIVEVLKRARKRVIFDRKRFIDDLEEITNVFLSDEL